MTLRSYQCAKCEHTWTGLDGHCHLCGGAGQQMESTLDRAISEGLPASEILDLMKEEQQVDLDRALTFLAEGWSDFLKKKYEGGVDTSHDGTAEHQHPHDIINHFADNADPSKKKLYTQHIMRWYGDKTVRQDDHAKINRACSGSAESGPFRDLR